MRFFPLPKDPKTAKSWRLRIGRRPEDVTDKMLVCSDHFNDEDFINHVKIKLSYHDKMHIRLNPLAVPNTDSETREMRKNLNLGGTTDLNADSPGPSNRSRKRVRRDIASIEEFIHEQELILEPKLGDERPNDEVTDSDLPSSTMNVSSSTQTILCECSCTCSDGGLLVKLVVRRRHSMAYQLRQKTNSKKNDSHG